MSFNKTHVVFSIYDSKAESFSTPFIQTTVGLAIRFLETLTKDPQTALNKYPEDHTLFRIGEWDERKGEIKMDTAPVSLARSSDYIEDKVLKEAQ